VRIKRREVGRREERWGRKNILLHLSQKMRKEAISQNTRCRTQAQNLIEEALHSRSQSLLHFYTNDLHQNLKYAKDNIRYRGVGGREGGRK
jgi:hypothetical protein